MWSQENLLTQNSYLWGQQTLLDNDVYYINEILAHKGKPAHRTSMEFLIHWADGKISWDRFNASKDNFANTIQFKTYCDKYPELRGFLKTRQQAEKDEADVLIQFWYKLRMDP